MAYRCILIYLAIRLNLAFRRPFCCDFFMSFSHNSNIPDLILLKLGKKTIHYGIQMHVNLYIAIRSNMAARWPFCCDFTCLSTITQTSLKRFCSNLAQKQSTMAYRCMSTDFAIRSNLCPRKPFCCNFFVSLNHNPNVLELILF